MSVTKRSLQRHPADVREDSPDPIFIITRNQQLIAAQLARLLFGAAGKLTGDVGDELPPTLLADGAEVEGPTRVKAYDSHQRLAVNRAEGRR
jgi:hypothetical protein